MNRNIALLLIAVAYFTFAMLLNSVGIVILQLVNVYQVSPATAGTLEGFKDISIAVSSFVLASFIPLLGFTKTMYTALLVALIGCLLAVFMGGLAAFQMFFACAGFSFALVKVCVYSLVGQLSLSAKNHTSLLNTLEGIFMIGVLSGYWLFSIFMDPVKEASWLNTYLVFSTLLVLSLVLVYYAKLDQYAYRGEQNTPIESLKTAITLCRSKLIFIFYLSLFLYVLIEQGIGTWLPTYNKIVLNMPESLAVQVTSLFAAALAIGRLTAAQIIKRVSWEKLLTSCLLVMLFIIGVLFPIIEPPEGVSVSNISNLPLSAYVIPLLGLFLAPIYPILNSVMLNETPKNLHASMTGLIIVFSALGGTVGSLLTGVTFENFDGETAFSLTIIPISFLLLLLLYANKQKQPNLKGVY